MPAVSIGTVGAHPHDAASKGASEGIDIGRMRATVRLPAVRNALVLVGFMSILAVIVGDSRVGLGAGSLVAAAVASRFIDRHVAFSFGAGFVGYRSDMGWPHGVQEDDDVHWDWRAQTVSAAAEHRT